MTALRIGFCTLGLTLCLGGCADSTGRVGGIDRTTVRGPSGERLTLVKPENIHLKRGKAESVMVHLRRDNFSERVRVSVTQLPSGVEAVDEPRSTNSDRVEVVLRAGSDADRVQNHQALVTAEGPDGIRATETLEISVQ